MDETPLFADNMGKRTLDVKGAKEVRLRKTGNSKKFQTLVLSINMDGSKNKPCIVFKGKGNTAEARVLKHREDIAVFFSDNGWMNTELTKKWIQAIFGENAQQKKLLIWDSFKCHYEKSVKQLLHGQNIFSAVIPGGCTSQVQTLDVCINRPLKARMEELYDDFMADETQHTFTKKGNMRAPSMTQMCNMVATAWEGITADIILRSFKVCGQMPDCQVSDILAFRDGKTCSGGREKLETLWDVDPARIDLDLLTMKDPDDTVDVNLNNVSEEEDQMDYEELPDPEDPLA